MTINRTLTGSQIDVRFVPVVREATSEGKFLMIYQAEWGVANEVKEISGSAERFAETLGLVPEIDLASTEGATLMLYRATDGNEVAASYTQAGAVGITAKYAGTKGNDFKIIIAASTVEIGKKELTVKDGTVVVEKYSFVDADELVEKGLESKYVTITKLGTTLIADVVETALVGGVSGSAVLTASNYDSIFAQLSTYDFRCVWIPSTNVAISASVRQFLADREEANKFSTYVTGVDSASETSVSSLVSAASAFNSSAVVLCGISGTHADGNIYSSNQWAAYIGGVLCANATNISTTGKVIPLTKARKSFSISEVKQLISNGVLVATRNGTVHAVESGVNTLVNAAESLISQAKIRPALILQQILNQIAEYGRSRRGQVANNEIGGGIVVGEIGDILANYERSGYIDAGWSVEDGAGLGDARSFSLANIKPLDSIDVFNFTVVVVE